MFITNHVLAGTLAGTALRRHPVLAFAAGFATHVAMDMTPHWGDPTIGRDGFYAVAKRDGMLGLGVIALVTAAGVPPRAALLAGIAGAAVLDADKPAEFFFGFNPFPAWVEPVPQAHPARVTRGDAHRGGRRRHAGHARGRGRWWQRRRADRS